MHQRIVDANLRTVWDVVNLLPMVFDFIDIDDMEIELTSTNNNVMVEFNVHSTRPIKAKDKGAISYFVREEMESQHLHTFVDEILTVAIHICHDDYERAIVIFYEI